MGSSRFDINRSERIERKEEEKKRLEYPPSQEQHLAAHLTRYILCIHIITALLNTALLFFLFTHSGYR